MQIYLGAVVDLLMNLQSASLFLCLAERRTWGPVQIFARVFTAKCVFSASQIKLEITPGEFFEQIFKKL